MAPLADPSRSRDYNGSHLARCRRALGRCTPQFKPMDGRSRAPARGPRGAHHRRGERILAGPPGKPGGGQRTPKGRSDRIHVRSMDAEKRPPEGLARCLTRHSISAIRWPPAPSTRPIGATTTTDVKGLAILISSRSSTWAGEPSRSATTVAGTQASCPSATPTGWLPLTARKRPGRVLHLLLIGGVSPRPCCDQPHRARVGHVAASHRRHTRCQSPSEDSDSLGARHDDRVPKRLVRVHRPSELDEVGEGHECLHFTTRRADDSITRWRLPWSSGSSKRSTNANRPPGSRTRNAGRAHWVTTIFPWAWPCSTYAIASRVWSKSKVRSSTGRRVPSSYRAARVVSCAPSACMKKKE